MKKQKWAKSNNFKDNKNDDEKQAHFSHSVSGVVAGFLNNLNKLINFNKLKHPQIPNIFSTHTLSRCNMNAAF